MVDWFLQILFHHLNRTVILLVLIASKIRFMLKGRLIPTFL